MTSKMLDAAVAVAGSSFDKKGRAQLPEQTTMTLHVAHDGVTLTVGRVVALTVADQILTAEDDKGERHIVVVGDLFAATVAAADVTAGRKAGFLR